MEKILASPEYRQRYQPPMHLFLCGRISRWHCLAVPLLAGLLAEAVLFGVQDIPAPAAWLSYAAATVLVGHLVHPAPAARHDAAPGPLLSWGIVTAGSFLVLATTRSGIPADPLPVLLMALGVYILTLFLGSATLFLSLLLNDRARAWRLVCGATLLAASTPLWLAPLAEQLPPLTATTVNVSPLTYLAVISDYDFLRSSWFYRHTPLGGLRYSYPATWMLSGAYLALTGMLLLASRAVLKYRTVHRPGNHDSIVNQTKESTP